MVFISAANAVVITGIVYIINNKNTTLQRDQNFWIKLACITGISSFILFEVIKEGVDNDDKDESKLITDIHSIFKNETHEISNELPLNIPADINVVEISDNVTLP